MYSISNAFLTAVKPAGWSWHRQGRILRRCQTAWRTCPSINNDIETFRAALFYVGQVLGGFFVINRSGQMELKKYGNQPVLTVERRHRFTSSFSDFITRERIMLLFQHLKKSARGKNWNRRGFIVLHVPCHNVL